MRWSELRAVVLDMGGVLVDLGEGRGLPVGEVERQGRAALVEALESAGGRIDDIDEGRDPAERWDATLERHLFAPWRSGHRRRYERGAEEPWEPHLVRLRAVTGARLSDPALLAAWFGPFGEAIPRLPGAREALVRLQDLGLELGLVSNVPLPGFLYRRVLERHRLLAPFSALRFSSDAGVRKPHAAMLVEVLDELGVEPGEAVMVGDRLDSDIAAGRAAGTATVWLTEGRGTVGEGPPPDRTLGSLAELPGALETWSAAPAGGPVLAGARR